MELVMSDVPAQSRSFFSRLQDLSIRSKVLAAVVVAAAMAVLVGVLGLVALGSSAQNTEDLYEDNILGIRYVANMRYSSAQMRIAVRDAAMASAQAARDEAFAQ